MASTSSFGRANCKRNVAGKVCRCQEWEPSGEDESLCDCCEHHMSFHEPCHPITSGYGKCLKEFDDVGSSHEDGCQEFCPYAPNSRKCGGCGCHRSYHEKVTSDAVGELAGSSNIHNQQQDFLYVDSSSPALIQPSSKKLKLDPAIILTEVDEDERAVGSSDGQKHECGVPDVPGTTIADGDLQDESRREDGNTTDRDHLEPKHKVFLSHSGVQKDFVEQLCIDLERSDRYPFFDKRWSSLPVGMKFPKLLFAAIQQCEVGVVVLSEEFFTKTKWPMLELVEMVKESNKLESRINIVPVFFCISREECREPITQKRWASKWEEWAETDKTIKIDEWKEALKIFGSTTGLPLKGGEVQLRAEVVEAVCHLVLPESRWDDSDVEGKDRLCKVILENVDLKAKGSEFGVRVVGLHGMGGIGKTTICKVLCNKLFKEFRGKVCHTELKSASEVELFRAVLKILTDTRHDLLDGMNFDKCRDQLKRCTIKEPIFLAIDNVDEESSKQAKTYLEAKHIFGNGSMVVVTARSLDQLKALNIHEDDCVGMPELEPLEARALFKTCATPIGDTENKLNEEIITRCAEMCRFQKGDGVSHHYHPLALKVLGNELREQMGCNDFDSKLWNAKLLKIEESHELLETKKQIFSILRISYDSLSREDQMLFMDVALFVRAQPKQYIFFDPYDRFDSYDRPVGPNLFQWLGIVHGQRNHDVLKTRLEKLKKKSLLEKVGYGSPNIGMHDLWREFCVAETKVGKFADRRWVYFEEECNELGESSPSGHCWENLTRMCFKTEAGVQKFLGLRLDHFLNVKVLKVVETMIARDPVDVDLGKLIHLKNLEFENYGNVRDPDWIERIKVRGLGLLSNLAVLTWIGMPAEVKYAEDIGCLTNLHFLTLPNCGGDRLPDMSKLNSLQVACFQSSTSVETITGLSTKLSNLRSLNLAKCYKLRSCPGLGDLIALETLDLSYCCGLEELPNLRKLTNLKELQMTGCSSLRVCPGLCGLRYLRKMDICYCSKLSTLPCLSDLVSLEELQAKGCSNLAELPDMRNLTKLELLNIRRSPVKTMPGLEGLISLRELWASFELLKDWPDLQNLTSLRRVEIHGCSGRGLTSIVKHAMLEYLQVYKCKEVDVLLDLRNLKRIQTLEFRYGDLKFMCVTNASELQSLSVLRCQKLEALDLSSFPRLQKLWLSDCDALKRLTIREPMIALRSVEVTWCKRLEEVSDLSNFPDLQKFALDQCASLTRITSEKALPTLKILLLWGCKSLIALLDLSYFPHLETLDLRDCKSLTSLSSELPLLALEKLDLAGCNSLKALPNLSNFTRLTSLGLEGCDSLLSLTSSKPLPALQYLNLVDCRSLEALPDYLCSSVKLSVLGIGGSGIVLSEDYVNKLLSSCVDLNSVDTSVSGEDLDDGSENHPWDDGSENLDYWVESSDESDEDVLGH